MCTLLFIARVLARIAAFRSATYSSIPHAQERKPQLQPEPHTRTLMMRLFREVQA